MVSYIKIVKKISGNSPSSSESVTIVYNLNSVLECSSHEGKVMICTVFFFSFDIKCVDGFLFLTLFSWLQKLNPLTYSKSRSLVFLALSSPCGSVTEGM